MTSLGQNVSQRTKRLSKGLPIFEEKVDSQLFGPIVSSKQMGFVKLTKLVCILNDLVSLVD